MKRQAIIALGILALTSVIFALIHQDSSTADDEVETAFWEPVDALDRIEISPPADHDELQELTIERGDDGWSMRRPEQWPVDPDVTARFEAVFGSALEGEKVVDEAQHPESYGLGDHEMVYIAIFEAGQKRPAHEWYVGSQLDVPQTDVRHTFVQEVGENPIYRVRGGFANLVRLPLSKLRHRDILDADFEAIDKLGIDIDGEAVVIERIEGAWKLVDAPLDGDQAIDADAIDELAGGLAELHALRWASSDDEIPSEPDDQRRMVVGVDGTDHEFVLGPPTDDQQGRYARRSGDDDWFVLAQSAATHLEDGIERAAFEADGGD